MVDPAKALYTRTLTRLRKLCLALPETTEVPSWGHPNFKAGKKTYAVLEVYDDAEGLDAAVHIRDGLEAALPALRVALAVAPGAVAVLAR